MNVVEEDDSNSIDILETVEAVPVEKVDGEMYCMEHRIVQLLKYVALHLLQTPLVSNSVDRLLVCRWVLRSQD